MRRIASVSAIVGGLLALLPKPFQLSALTGRDLQLESPWKRFIVRPPR